MNQEFFVAVNRRLKELEAERDQRYRQPDESLRARDYLFKHPAFLSSAYWCTTDRLITSDHFDWDSDIFPVGYIEIVNALNLYQQQRMACRPYVFSEAKTALYENTKTLAARLHFHGILGLLKSD